MRARPCQVLIVGGGPAGAALAWLLAQDGVATVLVDDGVHRGGAPLETLLPGSREGLERSALRAAVEAAATVDRRRHGAIWGAETLVWRDDPEPGLLLERGAFDLALQLEAAAAGAAIVAGARVLGPLPPDGTGPVRAIVRGGGELVFEAERLVVAAGRRSAALLEVREEHRGVETFALTLAGRCPDATHLAIVEAVPAGWWWWIGDGHGGGAATLVGDAAELQATGAHALLDRARWQALGPVRELQEPRIRQATRATARLVRATGDALLLGDAAASIDPLSTQGVEKALSAADHAAAALRTALAHPEWWPRLVALHAGWERDLYLAHGRTAAAFLRREERFVDAPFWRRRRAAAPAAPAESAPADGPLVRTPEVVDARVLERFGQGFREVDGALHEGSGETRAHVGYVPVAPVLAAFDAPRVLADGVQGAGRDPRLYVLPPAAVEAAARELLARGWLRRADAAGSP